MNQELLPMAEHGFCEKLNRFFDDRKDLNGFCDRQDQTSPHCINCRKEAPPVERGREESQEVNLTAATLIAVKRLAAEECPNHLNTGPFKTKNYCWMREKVNGGVCWYFSSVIKRCSWFEGAVLSLQDDLKETYFKEIQKQEVTDGRSNIHREAIHGIPGNSGTVPGVNEKSGFTLHSGRERKKAVPAIRHHGLGKKEFGFGHRGRLGKSGLGSYRN